jgi:DNA repair exonuclease SbcCD nuclease subunit
LDTPFDGIARASEHIAEALRDASLDAFDSLVELAIKRDATFLVLAGDIYDGADRGVRAQLRFIKGLKLLHEHRIEVFIVHGNHDPLDGWSAVREWPPNVTVFHSDDVRPVQVIRDGKTLATVYGISYGQRDVKENLSLRYSRSAETGLHVGLLHCNVGNNSHHEPYSPCTLDDLVSTRMDYWALGHIHSRQILRSGDPWVVYPGNLQGRSPKASELGPKGAMVVEVSDDRVRRVEFSPVDHVRFIHLEQDVDECNDLPTLESALLEQMASARAEHEDRSLVIRTSLKGRGILHRELMRPGTIGELLKSLRQEAHKYHPFIWWESLRDESRDELDFEVLKARGDFSSELLSYTEDLSEDTQKVADFVKRSLGPLVNNLKLGRLVPDLLEAHVRAETLSKAQLLALEYIEEGRDG